MLKGSCFYLIVIWLKEKKIYVYESFNFLKSCVFIERREVKKKLLIALVGFDDITNFFE